MDDKQVTDLIARALQVVKAAKTPTALEEVAFTSALALMTGSPYQVTPARNIEAAGQRQQPPPYSNGQTGPAMLDRIAAGLGLTAGQVVHLFADKDGVPELKVKSSKLPSQKAAGARDIALLVMAARQLGELDVLRETSKHYGRLDSTNFAKHMRALDHCTITTNRSKKLTNPGIEEASELAQSTSASRSSRVSSNTAILPSHAFAQLPPKLRDDLLGAFEKIVHNFAEGRWEPAELNGGKLCEAAYSICKGILDGSMPNRAVKPGNMVKACRALEEAQRPLRRTQFVCRYRASCSASTTSGTTATSGTSAATWTPTTWTRCSCC
jgi:hypothetical protein